MINRLFVSGIALAVIGVGANAQITLTANWEVHGGDIAGFPASGGVARDIAYNPGDDTVLVPTRAAGSTSAASMEYLDAATGASLGFYDTTGIAASTSGFFKIHQAEVADDDTIYACSLDIGAGGDGSDFTIWRWGEPGSSPTIAINSTTTNQRTGDSFAAVGSGASTVLYASGSFNTNIEVFTTADGITFVDGTDVAVADATHVNTGLDVLPNGNFVGNSIGEPVREISTVGADLASIGAPVIPLDASSVTAIQLNGVTLLATHFDDDGAGGAEARVVRLEDGTFATPTAYAVTPASYDNATAGAFNVGEAIFDTTRGALLAIFPNNTIGSYGENLPAELGFFATE